MAKTEKIYLIRLALVYFLIAICWFLFSNHLLSIFFVENVSFLWQSFILVLTSTIILYSLLRGLLSSNFLKQRKLTENNEELCTIIKESPLAIITLDLQYHVTSWNLAAQELFGWQEKELLGITLPIIPPDKMLEARNLMQKATSGKTVKGKEVTRLRKDGSEIIVSLSTARLCNTAGTVKGLVAIYSDITDQKEKEEQLKYLSLYDSLTGLYNRAYFEQEMQRLEKSRLSAVGLIICDVDGLKMYNDSLGHSVGDKLLIAAATVLKSCFRESDVVARIGGDEFAILLPETIHRDVLAAHTRIREAIKTFNDTNEELFLSLSIGYSVTNSPFKALDLFKAADDLMYREKILNSEIMPDSLENMFIKSLHRKDHFDSGHIERIENYIATLAAAACSTLNIDDLRLFARYHDLGKVVIPNNILNKKGTLTSEERDEIKRHTEIGYRMALSNPKISHLADWILKHHEWWDGNGYPLGLKGEDIPLACRIFSIADAYDALTSTRPYRRPQLPSEAIHELRKNAGTQFDPGLLEIFIKLLKDDNHKIPNTI